MSEDQPEQKKLVCGGPKTCDDCGESFNAGTDLTKYGCRCRRAMFAAAKANRAALDDKEPQDEGESTGQPGGRVKCDNCWGFYNKGTNLRVHGCPCLKAKYEAVFADQGNSYCQDLQCHNLSPCPIHQASTSCGGDESDFGGYTVYYWPGFSGRGQPLMAMLADAGAKYQRVNPDSCKEKECFACPMVRRGNYCMAQTGACAAYLGEELGFNHPPALRHVANKLNFDIADLWSEVYEKRSSAASWAEVDAYCGDRGADWLCTLDVAAAKYGTPGHMLGKQATYIDFLLWNALEVVRFCFGEERFAGLLARAPHVAQVYKAVNSRPGVVAYVKEEPVLYAAAKSDAAIPIKH